jgi:hypothetical protein
VRVVDEEGMNTALRPVVTEPEPDLVLVAVSARLVLRVALVAGFTVSGWMLDGEAATDPMEAAQA